MTGRPNLPPNSGLLGHLHKGRRLMAECGVIPGRNAEGS